jgi:hypothetical protein
MAQRLPFSQMTPEDIRQWIQATRLALQRKMQREQAYLTHRARRGLRTPTDEAYEADQELEADLLCLLDELEQHLEINSW